MVDERARLQRRYLSLGLGELGATAVFVIVALLQIEPALVGPRGARSLWSALGPLAIILVQAGVYWLGARGWVNRRPMPQGWARTYRFFRRADPVLLAAGLVGLIRWWPEQTAIGLLLVLVWLFAVIEYLNYFVVRLSYPVWTWWSRVGRWRRPRLLLDLREADDHPPRTRTGKTRTITSTTSQAPGGRDR